MDRKAKEEKHGSTERVSAEFGSAEAVSGDGRTTEILRPTQAAGAVRNHRLSEKEQQEYLHITVENSKKNLKLLAFGIVSKAFFW